MSDNEYRERGGREDRREDRRSRRSQSEDFDEGMGRGRRSFSDDDERASRGGAAGGRARRRKEDYFDANKVVPDYKDVDTLKRFLTDRAKIRPRRQTGLSSKNQRKLALQIKRARHLALLPFTDEQLRR